MMIYAWIGSLIAALAAGAYGGYQWESGRWAQEEAKRLAAEAQVAEQARELEQEAANKLVDMSAAYEAGESKARVIVKTVVAKGQAYAASDQGLSNPACVMAPASLQYLRAALSGMRSATDPGESPAAMPGAGTPGVGNIQRTVPPDPAEHGTVGTVHQDAGQAGDSGQVPGRSVRPPKPIPRQKGVTQ